MRGTEKLGRRLTFLDSAATEEGEEKEEAQETGEEEKEVEEEDNEQLLTLPTQRRRHMILTGESHRFALKKTLPEH
jgi:hypothetical protein